MSDSTFNRITKDDLSWFKLSNYEAAKTMGLLGWRNALLLRYTTRGLIDSIRSPTLDDPVFSMFAQLLLTPITKGMISSFSPRLAKGFSRVWDVSVLDVFTSGKGSMLSSIYAEPLEQCEEYCKRLDEDAFLSRDDDLPLVHMSFDDYKASKGYTDHNQHVIVDLLASDEQLINDFTQWLAEKRAARNMRTFNRAITEDDTREWARYQILPYIDLQLFCAYTRTKLTQWDIGNLLFPGEDINPAERIRKVVKSKAEQTMDGNFLAALDEQVVRTERKDA